MKQLAEGVWHLDGFPKWGINAYVLGDVLVDAGFITDKKRILKQIEGVELSAHALTHAHLDHFGASAAVVERHNIPMWVGELDVEAAEAGKMVAEIPGRGRRMLPAAPAVKVDRALKEGDEVGGFEVLFTPGHSPGHVSYWRESDRTLVCGDVMWGHNTILMRGGPREPVHFVSPDYKLNRESAKRLADLRPELVCFGHGPPMRDPDAFAAAVGKLG